MQSSVVVNHRAEERLRAGHPWIYRTDVVQVRAVGGDVVRLIGARGRRLGSAFYSDRSEIALRFVAGDAHRVGPALWPARLAAAVAFRDALRIDATAYRLVHAEADLLPSLVVDCYGEYLVIQTLSQGPARLQRRFVEILRDLLAPAGILARNDARVRALEGLPSSVEVLHGRVPETVVVREGKIELEVDLRQGQKTGLFLDQRENRGRALCYARGRALDCFSYQGGFGLRLAGQCQQVMAVDSSEEALRRLERNAARNGLSNVQPREANVFDLLRTLERARERFDTIVLDPPAFAKGKAAAVRALAGYKEINLRALRLLSPGGYLITSTCSYHVDEAAFLQVVHAAALDAHATVVVVEKRTQGRDHPVLLGVPETRYLKCLILRKLA